MRVISDYVVKKTGDEYTLIPYGQAVAEHLPELTLNRTGAKIYRYLQNGERGDELVAHVAKSIGVDVDDEKSVHELAADIEDFIRYLRGHGIIVNDTEVSDLNPDMIFMIAGIPILYYGDDRYVDDKLRSFEIDSLTLSEDGEHEVTEPLVINVSSARPRVLSTGEILLRTEELFVSADEESMHVVYLTYRSVREMHINKDSGTTTICVAGEPDAQEIFYAMRTSYLLYASRCGRYAIHSSSILYNDKVYVFSAPAGTGKSTHTALWNKLYGTPVINGDLNLVSIEEDGVYVHGIPWCGTSEIYDTESYRLGGVILLARDDHDHIEKMTVEERIRSLRQRLITPAWDEIMLYDNNSFSEEAAELIPIVKLYCTPEDGAAVCAKEEIDKWDV